MDGGDSGSSSKDELKSSYSSKGDMNHEVINKRPLGMTVPERIVLSAGYDGDDNEGEAYPMSKPDIYGDQPIIPPDVLMVGMQTPPSTLTIDHTETAYSRSTAGDGSDTSHPQFQNLAMLKKQYADSVASDSESRLSKQEGESERMALVGREDDIWAPHEELSLLQLQRRIRMLENELIETQRSQNIWKVVLFALTIINPIVFNYILKKR